MAPSPSVTHQFVSGALFAQLFEQARRCRECTALMAMDWDVSTDTVVRPDVMVVYGKTDERVTRTPWLVCEVVSTRTAARDEKTKFDLYEHEGVEWYVRVYPDRNTAKVYRRAQGSLQKVGDFADEIVTFSLDDCRLDLEFASIWRR